MKPRMFCQTFRQADYFVGSGLAEAGCKTVFGQRPKHSGMLWGREGASDLLAVRCALLIAWFEGFWKNHSNIAPGLSDSA